ncbi:hypothetical protein [Variovorax sp. PAMC26660]|uniref:hypothetical protein n=1 Tax=Variovorax sp. PAMC26660 TaxID=2762322 RepID=UPI00164D38A5|nr:hypothetical protein [Variovorax sp. PAMC26660]QNK67945.1 hypothetical protein H7F35_33335 [Variovorax sp. PAMC26660]
MRLLSLMRRIGRADIEDGSPVITVEMPYEEFVKRFGERHSDHPPDWDAPGPVELWFFELPWGHKITLEYHTSIDEFNIYVESFEFDAVLDFLDLRACEIFMHSVHIELLRARYPVYTKDLGAYGLFRLDECGDQVLMHAYESRRVADYYRQVYQGKDVGQRYRVESVSSRL